MKRLRLPLAVAVLALVAGALAWLASPERDAPETAAPSPRAEPEAPAVPEPEPEPRAAPAPLDVATAPAPTREALSDDRVVRGEVVRADDGAPLRDVRVRLVSFRETRAEATTDADGAFELPWMDVRARAVEVDPPEGFTTSDHRQRVRGDEPPSPLRFELEPATGVPVAVRLVDALDGSPLNGLDVQLVGPKASSRRVKTDADGVARIDDRWDPGDVRLMPVGPGGSIHLGTEVTFRHDEGIQEVPLAMGPTIELNLLLPPGCERDGLTASLESERWPPLMHLDDRQPVRDGPRPWVRFMPHDVDFAGDAIPRHLVVVSEDGLWRGSSPVSQSAGRVPDPVVVELEPCGAIHLSVRGARGGALERAWIRVSDPEDRSNRQFGYGVDGRWTFGGLAPGTYDVQASAEDHVEHTRAVEVADGRASVVEIRLEAADIGGAVSGELRSRSGRAKGARRVTLSSVGHPGDVRMAVVRWTSDEEPAVGRFQFEDVPAGRWALTPGELTPDTHWDPPVHFVEPPASELVFTLKDDLPLAWIELEAVDRGSGEPPTRVDARLGAEDLDATFGVEGSGRVSFGLHRTDRELRWRVTSAGYVDAYGTLADLRPTGTRDGLPVLRAEVALEPGWEVRVLAWDEELGPIAEAQVSLDGVPVGVTDRDGALLLRRDAPPRLLRVEADGWQPAVVSRPWDLSGTSSGWTGPATIGVFLERP